MKEGHLTSALAKHMVHTPHHLPQMTRDDLRFSLPSGVEVRSGLLTLLPFFFEFFCTFILL